MNLVLFPESPLFTLKLLGGVALAALDGIVSGRAAQKRRLALLARLALAPERTLSRDKLIGLLWPDTDSERARHLLSVSLHELRRTLGEEIIVGRGDDLTLNPSLITTDVEEFEAALRQDQPEQVVRLYAGPFMDGFYASEGPDLEHWIDGERDRLHRQYAGALERCAVQRNAQGDLTGAVEYWRRLAALDPYNARVARALMLALDAAGDRAGALQHARVHTLLLQEEFGAQPEEEIVKLAERLRTAPVTTREARSPIAATPEVSSAPAANASAQQADTPGTGVVVQTARATRKHREHGGIVARPATRRLRRLAVRFPWLVALVPVLLTAATARLIWVLNPRSALPTSQFENSVAVMPFRPMVPNSDTIEYFGYGLSEEISNALGTLERLFVPSFTSTFLLRDRGAQEVGKLLKVRYVLEGTVNRSGGRLVIFPRLVDASTGFTKFISRYDEPWDSNNLTDVQNRIASAVADSLAVSMERNPTAEPLVKMHTVDDAARELYFKARLHYFDRRYTGLDTALVLLRAAVQADPNYALAWAGMAETYVILGAYDYGVMPPRRAYDSARAAAQRVLRLDATLAEPHAVLGVIAANHTWQWKAAERAFRTALRLNPRYTQAYHWYGLFLASQGRMDEAWAAITRARELDAASSLVATAFARHLYLRREFEQSVRAFSDVLQDDPSYVIAHAGIGLALVAQQQYDSALAHYRVLTQAMGSPTPLLRGLIAHAAGTAGRVEEARAQLTELSRSAEHTYVPNEYFALAHIGLGQKAEAISSLEAAYRAGSGAVAILGIEPAVDPLRGEPAFQALLRRVRLP